MKKLPTARQNNLVIQNMDTELLVYDLEINKAFSLNQTSALVYNACNGETTFDELKVKHNFTDDLIYLTLDELKKESLIADNNYQSPFVGMSRRQAARKVGLATLLALPVIMGVVAPTAAASVSDASRTPFQSFGRINSPGNCCPGNHCGAFVGCEVCKSPGVVYSAAPFGGLTCSQIGVFYCCNGVSTGGGICQCS